MFLFVFRVNVCCLCVCVSHGTKQSVKKHSRERGMSEGISVQGSREVGERGDWPSGEDLGAGERERSGGPSGGANSASSPRRTSEGDRIQSLVNA